MRAHVRLLLPALLGIGAIPPTTGAEYVVTVGGNADGGYGYEYPTNMFSPSDLTIQVGDTVVFENAGGTHNVAADDGSFRCAQGCDAGGGDGAPSGAEWRARVTFSSPGSFGYHCEVHQSMGMRGTITVQGAAPAVDLDQFGLSGSWANAATESQGVVMTVFPDYIGAGQGILFGGWFTFQPGGGQRWYTLQGEVSTGAASATLPIYDTLGGAFDSSQATTTSPVGEAILRLDDCSHGSLAYAFTDGSGRNGTIPIARLLADVNCSADGSNAGGGDYLRSGAWADLGNSGQGLVLDINPLQGVFFGAWYTFLHDAGIGAGAAGQHWYTLQAVGPTGFTTLNGIGIYESSGGVFDAHATTTTTLVGSADISWHDCSSATMTYAFTAGPNAGLAGTLDLARLGSVPDGCSL